MSSINDFISLLGSDSGLLSLAAEGETTFQGLQHLNRGYEQLEIKLQKSGAKLHKVDLVKENEIFPTSI